jgi:hypothetical protein
LHALRPADGGPSGAGVAAVLRARAAARSQVFIEIDLLDLYDQRSIIRKTTLGPVLARIPWVVIAECR